MSMEAPRTGGKTVLLAEDEPSVRRLVRAILERAGFTVIEAGDPDEAEAVARTVPTIDLLLTDVMMPGGTGPELFRRLSPTRPAMRVVFMSGYTERDLLARNAIDANAVFVSKPFSPAGLVATIRSTLQA